MPKLLSFARFLQRTAISVAVALVMFSGAALVTSIAISTAAYADDDDGGDDDGGDDDGGGGVSGRDSRGGNARGNSDRRKPGIFKKWRKPAKAAKRKARPARSARPARRAARPVIVMLDIPPAGLQQLIQRGYVVVREERLSSIGLRVHKLRVPRNTSTQSAIAEVLRLGAASADRNAFYRPQTATDCDDGRACATHQLIAWPSAANSICLAETVIGVVDTRVNLAHPALEGQKIEVIELTPKGYRKPRGDHGTAVVSLIAGRADGPAPGLLPRSRVIAANPYFWSGRSGDLAEAMDIVRALDALLQRQAPVINMSLAGPANKVMEEALKRVHAKGAVTVAAVGNAGPRAKPQFPAAYDTTISVTAVSDELSVYRRAGQGPHVDFSAPGVALMVASGRKGTARKSGTSFAAPFLAASIALLKTRDEKGNAGDIETLLASGARDLGTPGKDPVFGWGLVQAGNICP